MVINNKSQPGEDHPTLAERMGEINHKLLVLSGKGGVGKSTIAVNLAYSLALTGKRVGLLDVDIHGPSIPKLLGLDNLHVKIEQNRILPLRVSENLKVMSIGFLLKNPEEAVIWRGPMKAGVIKQFLGDVEWGKLDYLVIDCPPGTGDEPLSLCQLLDDSDGAVIVTTPQEISLVDVRKSINFCRQLKLPVLGVIENMSGFVCPQCGELVNVFGSGGGEKLAQEMAVRFLGRIPLDPMVVAACDAGKPYLGNHAEGETALAFKRVIHLLLQVDSASAKGIFMEETAITSNRNNAKEKVMRIAIPVANGKLAMHFGHCQEFALIDVDQKKKEIIKQDSVPAPDHQPGLLPPWLAEQGANMIIAGGMGSRAQTIFADNKIEVLVGAPVASPESIAQAFLDGTLTRGENACDH
ncbi:MAG: P-loop NTPase [Planctomycetes bacterium]|nr:P-loop NTPase [Planctomycetota bacterium]